MTEYWNPEKGNVMFDDEKKVTIILSYNWSPQGKPSSLFIYWGNEKYQEFVQTFSAEKFGREKIEKYWSKILELDKNKKLTLDTLCDTIETTFIPEEMLKALRNKDKVKAN
jgi:predicted transcriptional regulator